MTPLYHPRPERWLTWRFSLRALFLLMTLFAVWLGVQAKWIRDRREFVQVGTEGRKMATDGVTNAPWSIRILGERGIKGIYISENDPNFERMERQAMALFPEAMVGRQVHGTGVQVQGTGANPSPATH